MTYKVLGGLIFVALIILGIIVIFRENNTPTINIQNKTNSTTASNNTPVEYVRAVYDWKTYSGAWFNIDYPSDFSITESIKSWTSDTEPIKYDSAFFYTADKTAYFYVYSPQWSGTPNDLQILPGEKIISQNKEVYNDRTETTMVTVYGNEESERIVRDTTDPESNIHFITIFKYQKGNRFKFEDDYKKFYTSLAQFAD